MNWWWTPWMGTVLLVPVLAYSVRKRLPPWAWRPKGVAPDLAEREARVRAGIRDLQRAIYNRAFTRGPEIRGRVRELLHAHRLHRAYFPTLTWVAPENGDGEPFAEVRLEYRTRFGSLRRWLHFHVYVGTLASVVFLVHAGFGGGTRLQDLVVYLLIAVLMTGVFGAAVYRFLPARFASLEESVMLEEMERIDKVLEAEAGGGAVLRLQRERLAEQMNSARRREYLLHGWRVLHVPLATAWIAVTLVHVVAVWYY